MAEDIRLKVIENSGWELTTSRPTNRCVHCKEKLNQHNFYWCEIRDKFFCAECVKTAGTCPRWDHIDWHIVKVTRPETLKEREQKEKEKQQEEIEDDEDI